MAADSKRDYQSSPEQYQLEDSGLAVIADYGDLYKARHKFLY
jgi:hypothetical protein